jgi:hypothetical protein
MEFASGHIPITVPMDHGTIMLWLLFRLTVPIHRQVLDIREKKPPCFDPYVPPFGEQYYPCKILAFLIIPNKVNTAEPNRVVAIVQSCETRLPTDVASDTRLLQVWSLEYDKKVNTSALHPIVGVDGNNKNNCIIDRYRLPLVREVDVNSFDKRVLVIEENPGNHEQLLCKRNTNETVRYRRVFLVKSRDNSWAHQYLHWDSDKTRNYETAKAQANKKKKSRKKK